MARYPHIVFVLSILLMMGAGCGGCDDSEPGDGDSGVVDAGDASDGRDAVDTVGDATSDADTADSQVEDVEEDAPDAADTLESDADTSDATGDVQDTDSADSDTDTGDAGQTDGGDVLDEDAADAVDDAPSAVCGDGAVEGNEACDDGNTDDGDYCSADCSQVTGSCGDGTLQDNESCDDGATSDCAGTHDGGDGSCVPQGQCASGYTLDSNGDCVSNPTGLTTPCQNGSGWTVFRFHYDSGSSSARIDVWDASCNYSFANQACNVQEVTRGFGDFPTTSQGYPIVDSSEYIRVRFSVSGLNFTDATVHIQGRSYSTISSTDALVESPLYGARTVGPIDNDFVYDWYALDWTGYLYPSDDPNLTAIQIFADGGSSELAVQSVELCVE